MHNFKGIDFNMDDDRAFNGAIGTAKLGAGERVGDALSAAAAQNHTIVTGSDLTVGVVGSMASGGHGPVSSRFGLAADQVVEMEVVTATGELLTINQESSPDLFWAMRGVCFPPKPNSLSAVTNQYPGRRLHLRRHPLPHRARLPESTNGIPLHFLQHQP